MDKASAPGNPVRHDMSRRGGRPPHVLWLSAAALMLATCSVFWQVSGFGFTNFDDPLYLTNNPHVARGLSAEGLRWAFTTFHDANWLPLTWLSHMAGVQFFGLAPRGHHLINLLLHALSAALLFLLLERNTGKPGRSFLVALLFALHPLHVESVAWVSERKDVLSGILALLSLWCYCTYARTSSRGAYAASLGLYCAGLMAKPMLVTIPFILLIMDFWPLGRVETIEAGGDGAVRRSGGWRWNTLIAEKLPFFFLSLVSAAVTVYSQGAAGSMATLGELPPGIRLANAFVSLTAYLQDTFLPFRLAIFYPFERPESLRVALSALLAAVLSVAAYRLRRTHPWLPAGWLWFLVMLLPVIGIVQVGDHARADRYTYLALNGIFIMLVWTVSEHAGRYRRGGAFLAIAAVLSGVLCAVMTHRQLSWWRNDITLASRAIEVTRNNFKAHHALGVALARVGRFGEAEAQFAEVIRIRPRSVFAYYDMGLTLESLGKYGEAGEYYQKVLEMEPDHTGALAQQGGVLCREGNHELAMRYFGQALAIDAGHAATREELGKCRALMRQRN